MFNLVFSRKGELTYYIVATLLLFCSLLLLQCQSDKNIPDISDIQVEVKVRRFEQDLFNLDTASQEIPFEAQVEQLRANYPDFFVVFESLISNTAVDDSLFAKQLYEFVTHRPIRKLYDTTQILYKNIEQTEQKLTEAFRYFKYYFPDRPVPEVVSYISEYTLGTFTYGDSLLGIGWDFFLGESFSYNYQDFPAYIQKTMDKEYLVAKAIEAVASNLVGERADDRLLDYMISNGKILYIKSLLLPETPDSVLMEWSSKQLDWMENNYNERELWIQIINRELLYSKHKTEFDKLIGASPMGTTWMPKTSPGKTANWIGWQIVKAYLEKNPSMTTEELLAIKDAQQILDGSKYRPER